jgi:hypothetical protein
MKNDIMLWRARTLGGQIEGKRNGNQATQSSGWGLSEHSAESYRTEGVSQKKPEPFFKMTDAIRIKREPSRVHIVQLSKVAIKHPRRS